jgi:hypothetical protein
MAADSGWNAPTFILGTVLTVLTVAVGISITFSVGATSRIDALYSDVGTIKGEVGRIAANVDTLKEQMNDMKASLMRIEAKLQTAAISPTAAPGFMAVTDPEKFGKFLQAGAISEPFVVVPGTKGRIEDIFDFAKKDPGSAQFHPGEFYFGVPRSK